MAGEYVNPYNSMQAQAGIVPNFSQPSVPTSGQVSAQVAQMGAQQLAQMMAVTQIGQTPMGPFGTPAFPQLQSPFIGSPGFMPGPNGALYPMSPAGAASPYGGTPGYGGMAGMVTPPGNPYVAGPTPPPPVYRGAMGAPGIQPFTPPPPIAQFNTPYQSAIAQATATSDRGFAGMLSGGGVAARLGVDAGMGYLGARIGRQYGGGVGALIGGTLGFLGAETSGMGAFGQNTFADNIAMPFANTRAYGQGMEHLSRGFVSGGPELGPSGAGWSHHGALRAVAGLQDLAGSNAFQQETFGRFNTADVMRIAQTSGREGMLSGVETGSDLKGRVREVSKSLTSFMELANEPDVMRAIQVMSQMRTSGLNLMETQRATQQGRTFARMAGLSFEGLSNLGGAMGSSAFQSLGLTQGLGMTTGMANYGLAAAANNTNAVSPQLMNMLGGVQGMTGLNTMFSAGMLQMPMLAPGMMTGRGGLDPRAIQSLLSGQVSPIGMTSNGANAMSAMGQNLGVGGLGMALGMQPLLQDTIGRIVQSQGPFAQRHMEDRQIRSLMRNMNLSGSEGFMTAAQMMGMSGPQAMARAQELADPRTFTRERRQIETDRRERRAEELRAAEAAEPGTWDTMQSRFGVAASTGRFGRGIERSATRLYRSLSGGGEAGLYSPNASDERRIRALAGRASSWGAGHIVTEDESVFSRLDRADDIGYLHGGRGIGASLGGASRLLLGGASQDSETRAFQETGRFLSTALNSSRQSQAAAARSIGSTFGNQDNLGRFSVAIAQQYGNNRGTFGGVGGVAANLLIRGGASTLSRGLLDPENIAGSRALTLDNFRRTYVNSMHGRNGMSDEELGAHFDRNRSVIATQMGEQVGDYMTVEQRSRMRREMQAMSNLTSGGPRLNAEATEREVYTNLLGSRGSNRDVRRSVDQLFQFNGFGGTEQQRERSANYMAARAALMVQVQGETDPRKQAALQERMRELEAAASQGGVNTREANTRVRQRADSLQRDDGLRDALHGVNLGSSGSDVLSRIGQFLGQRDQATVLRRRYDGLQLLGRQDGAIGDAFRGVVENGNINEERLREQLANVGGDDAQMRDLASKDPELARMLRQYSSGGARQREAAFSQISRYISAQGGRSEGYRRQYGERGALGRAWSRVSGGGLSSLVPGVGAFRALAGAFQSEDNFVQQQTVGGTQADADATRQAGDSNAAQSQAGASGLGGAADQLNQASRQLLEVARLFRGGVQEQNMDNLFGDVGG